jgi:hypothetical protein
MGVKLGHLRWGGGAQGEGVGEWGVEDIWA